MTLNLLNQLNFEHQNLMDQLDWTHLAGEFSQYAYFDANKMFFELPPTYQDKLTINQSYELLKKVIVFIENDQTNALRSIFHGLDQDLKSSQMIRDLGKFRILDFGELNNIAKIIESLNNAQKFFTIFNPLNNNTQILNDITKSYLKPIRQFLEPSGEIDLMKHPELKEIFLEIRDLDLVAKKRLNLILKEFEKLNIIQINTFDIIDDRYVIPIKTDHFQSNMGKILSRSDSGRTLFVEPYELAELSNKRQLLQSKLEEKKFKIAQNFTSRIYPHHEYLAHEFKKLLDLDLLAAKAIGCVNLSLYEPIIAEQPKIKLYSFSHPLISNPVYNNIELDFNKPCLIISGPNTGGKTVALKAICLCHLLIHKGLFIPARDSEIYPFEQIFFLSDDQQNIAKGLSSFAAETQNYLKLLTEINTKSLVIIDEIFNTTTSEDASVLALSIFSHLIEAKESFILVSTHHQMLKASTHSHPKFQSAHVGFNESTMSPTYRFIYGSPGPSNAIKIFKSMAKIFPHLEFIALDAEKRLETKTTEYEKLLYEISIKNSKLDQLVLENNNLNHQLKNMLSAQQGIINLKTQQILSDFNDKINVLAHKAETIIQRVKQSEIISSKQIKNEFHQLKVELRSIEPEEKENILIERNRPKNLILGHSYFSEKLNQKVVLLSIDKKNESARARFGNMTIDVKIKDLCDLGSHQSMPQPPTHVNFHIEKTREPTNILIDARGMRLHEFESVIETAISDLLMEEIPFVEIIHGHGEGILKRWLRDYLKSYPQLKTEIPKHSQDGSTKIYLG